MGRGVEVTAVEDGCRPLDFLGAVRSAPYPALLESSLHANYLGRYSILCWEPFARLVCRDGVVEREDLRTGARERLPGDPFRALSAAFQPHRWSAPSGFQLPFAGGAVGYFSYDLRHSIESLPRTCNYDLAVPTIILCLYDRALVFDHHLARTYYVGPPGTKPPAPPPRAEREGEAAAIEGCVLRSNFPPDDYLAAVQRVKDYIAAGDIFQVNLSQRFEGKTAASGLALYEKLRATNPAPFAAYLSYPELEIISSSPERFLLLESDTVITRPIKGTRPRREGDAAFNRTMRRELLASEKDHAELAMIVDLERNDLGRVCRYGSVGVEEHAVLETYPTVYHLVSTVRGELYRERFDEFALLRATFPGGSITGAPKIRAMEIIEEIEPHARAVYTGAIGYVSFHGRMDLNIVIRTVVKVGDMLYIQVGGGIVADSEPELELRETLDKGSALFRACGAVNYDEMMGLALKNG